MERMDLRQRKKIKIIGVILTSAVFLWAGFVTIDCIRLRNSKTGTKPLITIREEVSENLLSYTGLGYTIKYKAEIGDVLEKNDITYIEQLGYGADFWLFDRVLVWGWIE